jgi:hypothetical protein
VTNLGRMTEPAPAPPPGPGVVPPFAAPPVEGRNSRLWVGLGIGGAFALLCCGGGIAALIALTVASEEAFNEQARVVIGDYLDAVEEREYGDAYDMLCEREQQAESRSQFEARVSAEPRISSYRVGEFSTTSNDLRVPVDVTYADGGTDTLQVSLAQNTGTGQFEVCGVEE